MTTSGQSQALALLAQLAGDSQVHKLAWGFSPSHFCMPNHMLVFTYCACNCLTSTKMAMGQQILVKLPSIKVNENHFHGIKVVICFASKAST
jgi:hypothetical protein